TTDGSTASYADPPRRPNRLPAAPPGSRSDAGEAGTSHDTVGGPDRSGMWLVFERGSADADQEVPTVAQRNDQQDDGDHDQPVERRRFGSPPEEHARDRHGHVAEGTRTEPQCELVRAQRPRPTAARGDEARRDHGEAEDPRTDEVGAGRR